MGVCPRLPPHPHARHALGRSPSEDPWGCSFDSDGKPIRKVLNSISNLIRFFSRSFGCIEFRRSLSNFVPKFPRIFVRRVTGRLDSIFHTSNFIEVNISILAHSISATKTPILFSELNPSNQII